METVEAPGGEFSQQADAARLRERIQAFLTCCWGPEETEEDRAEMAQARASLGILPQTAATEDADA